MAVGVIRGIRSSVVGVWGWTVGEMLRVCSWNVCGDGACTWREVMTDAGSLSMDASRTKYLGACQASRHSVVSSIRTTQMYFSYLFAKSFT